MNNQEYEHKKHECWEEFRKDNIAYDLPYCHRIYEIAFDRAYALGKQTEAITQEEIEKAADGYATDAYYPAPDYGWYESDDEQMREVLENTFKAGANFALGKQEKDADTVIQGWVARDANGNLWTYTHKPIRSDKPYWLGEVADFTLSNDVLPDLTWSDEPIEVEIQIKRKKNG